MADILFIEAFWPALFNDKVEFLAFSCHIQTKALTLHAKQQEIMATKEEVELFLSKFIQKVKVFGIVFRDNRGKNHI